MRGTLYVPVTGTYVIDCQGPHTLYIRNDQTTQILAGDVYRARKFKSSVELKAGLVGIVIPLRAVVHAQIFFTLQPSPTSLIIYPPQMLPHLVEFENRRGSGLLFSDVFMLPIHNPFNGAVTVSFDLETSFDGSRSFAVRVVSTNLVRNPGHLPCIITAGQTLAVPLQLIRESSMLEVDDGFFNEDSNTANQKPSFINCVGSRFIVTVSSSRGSGGQVTFELECRRWDQSFQISYVSHDGSVTQAAVIMPLETHYDVLKSKRRNSQANAGIACSEEDTDDEKTCKEETDGFPVLLTLHGSGVSELQHADSYKMMPANSKNYVFGVEGFYVIAPTRFGAHNWEGVGDLSARESIRALQSLTSKFSQYFPQSLEEFSIVSGHSMGGHGAWVVAENQPDAFVCSFPFSGWIKKEEYSNSNAFYELDIASSSTSPILKRILEQVLSEYHSDLLVSNLQLHRVHLRVGGQDATTHPWFTRRMYRLLQNYAVLHNKSIEEVPGKEHWWWDTVQANDGGVLNDFKLRKLYSECLQDAEKSKRINQLYKVFMQSHVKANGNSVFQSFSTWLASRDITFQDESSGRKIPYSKAVKHACQLEDVELTVVNPALHSGLCGVKVLQQFRHLSPSSIRISCMKADCEIRTRNVRKLSVSTSYGSSLFEAQSIRINSHIVDHFLDRNPRSVAHICFADHSQKSSPRICEEDGSDFWREKQLVNYGPIRRLYDRPFLIVYGTPPNLQLRNAMRQLAVYIANAHFIAHSSYVPVISDLDFKTNENSYTNALFNLIFIGCNYTNKVLKSAAQESASKLRAHFPGNIVFAAMNETATDPSNTATNGELYTFRFADAWYPEIDQSVVFSMPIYYEELTAAKSKKSRKNPSTQSNRPNVNIERIGMALAIHANSAEGYLHFSRLAWPVIPPMVRAPFANYLPDFLVSNRGLFDQGAGGIEAAGFFDNLWKFDRAQAYINY
jgi:hypothetical protein